MARRSLSFISPGLVLLVLALALFTQFLPTVFAFTNGQAATLVLGQPDFTSNTSATTASGMSNPSDVAVDPTSGKVFVVDVVNNRVLRFASGAALVSGAAADGVLGQPNFTSSNSATTASGMFFPRSVAVDSAGRLWVAEAINHRVLRFDGAATKANGAAADGVLGQPDFTTSGSNLTASGLNFPFGVAVDNAGRLWVADRNNQRVLRFDSAATKANGAAADGVLGQSDFTSSNSATTASEMNNPSGIAVDSAGYLWVADQGNRRVLRFDSAATKANGASADGVLGQPDFTTNSSATTASGMNNPSDVTVDSAGRLWVADTFNSRVLRFTSAASKANGAAANGVLGQPDFTSSVPATTASGMDTPFGVGLDSADNLWVAASANNRALRFDGPQLPIVTWTPPAAISVGTALSATQLNATANVPGTFTYTPASGTVLNVGAAQTLSVTFTPTDSDTYNPVTKTVTIDVNQANQTSQTITFAALPNKVVGDVPFTLSATASSGLPVSYSSTTPTVCTVSGGSVTIIAVGTCTIAANQAGNTTYAAAPQVTQSFTITQPSQPITFTNGQAASVVLGQPDFTTFDYTTTAKGMDTPYGVAVDPTSGKVFVADTFNNRVLRFASGTALLTGASADGVFGQVSFTTNISTTTASGMRYPFGVAVDTAGRLWVADTFNNRVLRFDNAATAPNGVVANGALGQINSSSSTSATTASGMSLPFGVAVDLTGRVWIADGGNNRVLRFNNASAKGNGAPADGVLGQTSFTSSIPATTASGMDTPFGVAVDITGHLWVADSHNSRIIRFDDAANKANGAAANGVLGQTTFTSKDLTTTASGMNNPEGVTVDKDGRLWVADTFNRRAIRFDGAASKANGAAADGVLGQHDFTSSVPDGSNSGMRGPYGVATDSAGRLWVADGGNNRLLRFDGGTLQTITFAALSTKKVGDAPFNLSATSSSGLPVTYSSSTPSVCTVSGTTVTLIAAGTCTITASQAGNVSFGAAVPVSQSFTVTGPTRLYLPVVKR